MHASQSGRLSSDEYPGPNQARDAWILDQRPAREVVGDPFKPHGFFIEQERSLTGEVASCATIFLTNRECPWRCLMCDLWKTMLSETVPRGAIPAQIDFAMDHLAGGRSQTSSIKLYNGGSFFDPAAIPLADYEAIAQRVARFKRIVVECHPALVGKRCVHFRDLLVKAATCASSTTGLGPQLEIAIGLETAHPEVLNKLNKRMTLDAFAGAARFLKSNEIALRVFVLVKPPFLDEIAALDWARRSVAFAFDHGATVVSLIPTRAGNGALDALQRIGQFAPPRLSTLEQALADGIALRRGRVFADLWDLERFSTCPACFQSRLDRLWRMNLEQAILPETQCPLCGGNGTSATELNR